MFRAYNVFVEELRAAKRGRFALLSTAILLAGIGLLAATAGTGSVAAAEYYLPVFGVAPMLLIPITAVSLHRARVSHFIDGVLTTRTGPAAFLVGKLAAHATLGLLLCAAASPLLLVESYYLPAFERTAYLALGVGGVVYACTLGLLVGVCFTARSIVPSLTTGVALMAFQAAALMLLRPVLQLEPGAGRDTALGLLHTSGLLLLHDALGVGSLHAADPQRSGLLLAIQVLGFLLGGWVVFTRAQSATTWEWGPLRVSLTLLALTSLLVPSAVADAAYEERDPIRLDRGSSTQNLTVRLTLDDRPPPVERFPERPVVAAGVTDQVFLWLFLHESRLSQQPFRDIELELKGVGLQAAPELSTLAGPLTLPRHPAANENVPQPYLLVPVTLSTPPPITLRENPHAIEIRVRYVDANGTAHVGQASFAILSEVPRVQTQVGVAAAAAPLLALAGDALRRWRMR